MLLLYIFIIVMLFSSVPYLVSMTKKASAGAAMRRALEQSGCKFIPVTPFWYLGDIRARGADFHVICDGRVVSVKVLSFLSANLLLNFIDKESYETKALRTSEKVDRDKVVYKRYRKKAYDFTRGLPKEYSFLPKARVILINEPYPLRVSRTRDGGLIDLKSADATPEGELYTAESFIKLFK